MALRPADLQVEWQIAPMTFPPFFSRQTAIIAVLVLTLAFGYAGGFWVAYPLMVLAMSLPIISAVRREPLWLSKDWAARAFLAAFVLLAVAFAISGDAIHVLNFVMFALFAPLSASLSRFASPRNAFRVATLANIGCSVGLVIACYQVFGLHMDRASAFGSDPIWSAQAGVIIAFMALLGLMTTDGPWRFSFVAGPLGMVVVAALSGSRGPLLAIPVLFCVFLLLGTRRWWLSLLVAGCAAVSLVVAAALLWPEALQRLLTIQVILADLFGKGQITESSAGERQLMYEAGLDAFRASPFFGHGWNDMMLAIAPYLPNGLASFQSVHHHLHSDVLDFLVSGGLLGLVAYCLILTAPILGVLRSGRDSQYRFRRIAAIGLGVGYATFGVSYLTFGYEYHTTLYVCIAAILVGFCRDEVPA